MMKRMDYLLFFPKEMFIHELEPKSKFIANWSDSLQLLSEINQEKNNL